MKMPVLVFFSIVFLSCQSNEPTLKPQIKPHIQTDSLNPELANNSSDSIPSNEYEYEEAPDTCNDSWISKFDSYATYKSACLSLKVKLKQEYLQTPDSLKEAKLEDISFQWSEMMVKNGIPFWLGTPWTFEGHTATPGEGTVACGYLVSTLLSQSGLNINRYYLAQQSAYNGAKTLNCTGEMPQRYYLNNIYKHIESLADGLYSVGLAYHVGYLWKESGKNYFIHSNYIGEEGVVIEIAECSDAFNASNLFLIVPITGNVKLTNKWLFSEEVKVVRQ